MSSAGQAGMQKKIQLTARQTEIIQLLTKFSASKPVTVSMIAEMLHVSSRTILREIPHIEEWLAKNDFHFVRKPGVGLILDESVENQKLILELLEVETVQKEYSKEERRRRILGELLYASEPLKAFYFTSKFHISEGTLSSDLDAIGKRLQNYSITLIRRPGLGILLEGTERSYRQAIANVVYESLDENEIMQMLRGESTKEQGRPVVHNRIFNLLDHETTSLIEQILLETEQRLHIRYTDSAYVGLVVHIGLAIRRIRNHEKIEMDADRLQKMMMYPEFSVAEEICDRLKNAFHVKIPRSEIGFVTMHLSSARIWPTDEHVARNTDSIHLHQLVREMIDSVEHELQLDINLAEGSTLLDDLFNHMAPMMSRLAMKVPIENSQLSTIREEYPDIFAATEHACEAIRQELEIAEIPESEIAFLAMHFGAALEKKRQEMKKIRVVVCCPSGIGTSRILETGIRKTFANIEVNGTVSAFRLDTKKLQEQNVDLIISTVNLTTDFPWISVQPILQEQDKRQIEGAIAALQPKKKHAAQTNPSFSPADIGMIAEMGEEILNLMQNLQFTQAFALHSRDEIIASAGRLFAQDEREVHDIEEGLYQRDQLADTYVKQFHMLLLHCQSKLMAHPRFGFVRLEPPVYENGRMILGAVVMLTPEESSIRASHQIVGALSALLVENKTLLERLRTGDWNGSRACIEEGLGVFYKNYLKKRIGVAGK